MFYVYALRSKGTGKLYIGHSHDLRSRIKKHLHKGVYTTKRMGETQLIFYEAFVNEKDAKERERYLKTTKGKRALKLMLKYTV